MLTDDEDSLYLIGGPGNNNLEYKNKNLITRASLPSEKSFFAALHFNGIIYTFGGYENQEKIQLRTCEYYDTKKDQWY